MGSPTYLSPEQARAEQVDARSDIWSLCVTLYECLTGRPPFEDASDPHLLLRILEDDPVPITARGVGDERLWRIIEKGLRKDRRERWQTVEQLARALEGWAAMRVGQAPTEAVLAPATRPEHSPEPSIPPAGGATVPPPAPAVRKHYRPGVAAGLVLTAALAMMLPAAGGSPADSRTQASGAASQLKAMVAAQAAHPMVDEPAAPGTSAIPPETAEPVPAPFAEASPSAVPHLPGQDKPRAAPGPRARPPGWRAARPPMPVEPDF
jgi:serine/threonine-protein kinase